MNKPIPDKLYFRIGEVARITGLKPYVLRYWETEFRELAPTKSGSLHRLYQKKDIEFVLELKKMLYEEKFTIAGAKIRLRELREEERKSDEGKYKKIAVRIRKGLEDIEKILS